MHCANFSGAVKCAFAVLMLGQIAQAAPHYAANRRAAVKHLRSASRSSMDGLSVSSAARMAKEIHSWAQPRHLTERSSWVISPTDYGADPTGRQDSTSAFQSALAALLSRNASGHTDESGTIDLGGALLDLQGGDYLISMPIAVPSNYSNYVIAHGTVRASPSFPSTRYLLEFGSEGSYCSNWGDSCSEDGSVEDLFLDASQRAAGCLKYWSVIGFNAGPDIYCLNFTDDGIHIEGGHEVVVHETWVGSCWYTPPNACWLNASALGSTTGILVNGNDHYVSDSIVFAALTGIGVYGAANMFTNVHTWNTQSGSVATAAGILNTVWQNRFVGCYMDFVPFVCSGCAVTTFAEGFFLGGAQVVFTPHPSGYPVRGVVIRDNQFAGLDDGQASIVALPPSPGQPSYSLLEDVSISGSMLDNSNAQSTGERAIMTAENVTAGQPVVLDFQHLLVWNASDPGTPIRTATVTALLSQGSPMYATVTGITGPQVTVLVVSPVPGAQAASLTVLVDQSTRRSPV